MRFFALRESGASGGGTTRFGGATGATITGADLARGCGVLGGSAMSSSTTDNFRSGAIERVTPFHRTRSSSLSRRLLMLVDRDRVQAAVQILTSAWSQTWSQSWTPACSSLYGFFLPR